MASKFSSADGMCEEDGCEAITDVMYYMEEKKKLCKDCASKKGYVRKARKCGPDLYCEKHDKDIDLYCKTHGVACCYLCAMIDHNEQPCVRQSIEDAMKENRARLRGLKENAIDKLKSRQIYGAQIRRCRQDADKHLQHVKDEVDQVIDKAMKIDKGKEQEDAAKINQETDEKNEKLQEEIKKINQKIQKNNEEREERLEINQKNAEKRRQPMVNKQRSLHADIQNIAEETERKIGELEKSWQDDTEATENTIQTLDTVLEDDQNVLKDGHSVITSVADELDKPLDEGGVKHIMRTVSGLRFVNGAGREKYNGRIDGYDGEWKLIDTINVTGEIKFPAIAGCIDEYNVIITGMLGNYLSILDMNTKHIQEVQIGNRAASLVLSCASLNDNKVVCGKWCKVPRGDGLTGCISVYDRQWKLINDVTIPRNTTGFGVWATVAADQDGMIIAAEGDQSKIYVINPADGKIMNTITCKQNIMMRGVLSSGHIVAQSWPVDHRVFIIDREGAQREITHSDVIWNVCSDPMTDDLYVMTSDDAGETCVIDQVMRGSDMKKRSVVSFPLSSKLTRRRGRTLILNSSVMIMLSGNMIVSDKGNIFVFKKMFSL